MDNDWVLNADRSEILADSGASGGVSGVSDRKLERKDERAVMSSTGSEGEAWELDPDEVCDLGIEILRVNVDCSEAGVDGFGPVGEALRSLGELRCALS